MTLNGCVKVSEVYVRSMSFLGRSSPMSYKAMALLAKATPLVEAAWTGDTELVQMLLEAKADLLANELGFTPEDAAKMSGHTHLLPFLSVFSV